MGNKQKGSVSASRASYTGPLSQEIAALKARQAELREKQKERNNGPNNS